MGLTDKARNKAEEATGKAKEAAGRSTGNERLEAEGRADRGEAGVKNAGEHVKDAARDAKDGLGGR
jgi:uncharacterized protein YjbJ (UPF0337 family)